MEEVIKAIYFALPLYFANMAPVLGAKLKIFDFLRVPVDFDKKIGNQNIFGKNKTWRGIVLAPIFAIIITAIQFLLFNNQYFKSISIIDYGQYWLLLGILGGLGAILGDLIKSFFKRRFNISPGRNWIILDQIDASLGYLVFTYFIAKPSLMTILIVIILALIIWPISNLIAFATGLKKVWW